VVDLFEALRPHVEREEPEERKMTRTKGGPLKLAIVGRPNAGKSTLVNRMLGEERMITGPEAGITRDSISLDWEWQGRAVRLVDTAGPAQARQGRRQARAAVGARHPPRDRLCRGRGAAARRHPRARGAGPADRRRR
jgi:predicted GTPase